MSKAYDLVDREKLKKIIEMKTVDDWLSIMIFWIFDNLNNEIFETSVTCGIGVPKDLSSHLGYSAYTSIRL